MSTAKSRYAASALIGLVLMTAALFTRQPLAGQDKAPHRLRLDPPDISTDKAVKYDYDIVYVRLPRKGFRATPGGKKFESPIGRRPASPSRCTRGPT